MTVEVPHFVCDVCSRVCLSRAELKSRMRSHEDQPGYSYEINILKRMICNKVCKSKHGLSLHMKIHNAENGEQATSSNRQQGINCISSSSSVVSAFGLYARGPGSIPTMAVYLFLALSRVVMWSPEVPTYCSSRLSARGS